VYGQFNRIGYPFLKKFKRTTPTKKDILKERLAPERPMYSTPDWFCPSCLKDVNEHDHKAFCPKCGQALDWS